MNRKCIVKSDLCKDIQKGKILEWTPVYRQAGSLSSIEMCAIIEMSDGRLYLADIEDIIIIKPLPIRICKYVWKFIKSSAVAISYIWCPRNNAEAGVKLP
jgi:hypothetical protein